MDSDNSGSLEEQVRDLRSRVQRLEAALQEGRRRSRFDSSRELSLDETVSAPLQPSPVAPEPPTSAVQHPPPLLGSFSADADRPQPSLESRIGSQWFNRVGILAILIAAAWFLKLAIDNHWVGPLGRVLIGVLSGAGIVAWSERFQRRGYAAFGYSLKAIGSGILYLSLWAAFSLYQLLPAGVAFAAMFIVTAFNAFMSWVQDAELLALYAIAGGLATPLLVSTGGNHEAALFSYLLLLDGAVLVLVSLRSWSRLLFGAFAATVALVVGWWLEFYSDGQLTRTALFLVCFFLLFAFAPRLIGLQANWDADLSRWDGLALVLMPIANAALGFIASYLMAEEHGSAMSEPWLAVLFAMFYLGLLRLPARGRLQASPALLSALHMTVAVVFLTIAIPLKAEGRWLTIGWLAEGAALFWVGWRVRQSLLRVLALICLAIGLSALFLVHSQAAVTPFLNARFGTYAAAIAASALVAWIARQAQNVSAQQDEFDWGSLLATSVLVVNALILFAVCLEIHSYWWDLRWQPGSSVYSDYRTDAQFTYSAWFMLFGATLLAGGFWRRTPFLRWQGLVLLAIAVGKVFVMDVNELSQGYRIVSFLGLGALLLAVSFVYQRDWLNLRSKERTAAEGEQRRMG